MTPPANDPFVLIGAWILLLVSLYYVKASLTPWSGVRAEADDFYTTTVRWKTLLMPLGFGFLSARWLLVGYGLLSPNGWAGRLMFLFGACGIIGGVAASRISRIPE